jgi:hypothetical protein
MDSVFQTGRAFQDQNYHLKTFFDVHTVDQALKSTKGYAIGFVVLGLANDGRSCEFLYEFP